jgi:hypothetical protein
MRDAIERSLNRVATGQELPGQASRSAVWFLAPTVVKLAD